MLQLWLQIAGTVAANARSGDGRCYEQQRRVLNASIAGDDGAVTDSLASCGRRRRRPAAICGGEGGQVRPAARSAAGEGVPQCRRRLVVRRILDGSYGGGRRRRRAHGLVGKSGDHGCANQVAARRPTQIWAGRLAPSTQLYFNKAQTQMLTYTHLYERIHKHHTLWVYNC